MKLYRINALLLKYYYITKNRMDRIFDIFYWPIIDLIIWGFASNFIEDISDFNLKSMLLGGIILWVFVWRASQDIAVFVLEDFWSKNLYHLFSSPVRISEHVLSIIILGFIRAIITFLFLVIIALLMYSFNLFSLPILFIAPAVFLLSIFGWMMGLFVTALIFRYGQRIQVLAWSIVWIIQPFSCIFYPLSSLPPWAANIAKLLPTTYVFETLRSILFESRFEYGGLLYAFFLESILFALIILFLRNSFERARRTGLLAKGD